MRKADFGIMTGNQETRLEYVGRMSSDYSAGIPIKKRRFPLYRPPSPPEEEIPLTAENDSEQKGHSSPSQGSAITDVIGVMANSTASSVSASSSSGSSGAANLSVICGAAMSSVSNSAANFDASGAGSSSIFTGTPAVGSASFSGQIPNAGFIAGDLNPSIAETGSNANVITAGSSAGTSVAEGSISGSVVGSVAKRVATISDFSGSNFPEHRDESVGVKNAILSSKIKQEELSFALHSGSLAEIDREEKPEASRRSAIQMINGAKNEFSLATAECSSSEMRKQIFGQEKVGGHCNLRAESAAYRKTELCLGFSHHSSTEMLTQISEACSHDRENSGSVALGLSLSKNDVAVQERSGYGNAGTEGASMMPNRSTWDLNMTIDAWEGPNNNDGADRKDILGSDPNPNKSDSAIGVHSPQTNAAGLPSQSHISEETNRSSSSAVASTPLEVYTDYSLRLGLVSSVVQLNLGKEPLSLPGKVDTSSTSANISGRSSNTDASRNIKSEHPDDNNRQCSRSYAVQPKLDITRVKQEVVERCDPEDPKSIDFSTLKSADLRLVKLEPAQDNHLEQKSNRKRSFIKLDELKPPTPNDNWIPSSPNEALLIDNAPSDFSKEGVDSHVAIPEAGAQKVIVAQHASEDLATSVSFSQNQLNVSGSKDDCLGDSKAAGSNIEDGNDLFTAAPQAVEGSVSENEKINLSEEASFASDYESDGTPNLMMHMDTVRADAEEGILDVREVWEPSASLDLEVPMHENMEIRCDNSGDTDGVEKHFEAAGENCPPLPSIEEDVKIKDPVEINNLKSGTGVNISFSKSSTSDAIKDSFLLEELEVQMPVDGNEEERLVEFTYDEAPDVPGKEDRLTEQDTEQTSNEVSSTSQQTSVTVVQGTGESGKRSDVEEKNDFIFYQSESCIHAKNAANDVNSGGNWSRIINLSRASNPPSSGKRRTISGSVLPSRVGRESLPDAPLEGHKYQHRGRDDFYGDGGRKFSRETHQSYSSRSSKSLYPRGRARFFSRMGPQHSGRGSGRNFGPEFYDGPPYSAARHRYASSMADADPGLNSCDRHNGSFFGTGLGGRKFFNDSSSFSRFPARRRSPCDSDGHNTTRGLPVIRRIPGNISPSRCTDEEGTELSGVRHGRRFQDCHSGPTFTKTQSYEELDGSFSRGNRNFQTLQRRGICRIRSKSPMRARTRSPGSWSPPGRTTQDAFGGSSELHPRRSPIYGIQRIRSPERPRFPRELVVQRHGSPPFVSRSLNDLREMDSARDQGHLRPAIHDRSPPGQVLLRNSRRLDLVDPREQTDCDNYYRGPTNSAGFHELGSDDNSVDRRRFSERQGPVHEFRHTYSNVTEGEDGPRTYRFCPENDSEYHENGNHRGREFDRRLKHQLGDMPPRRRGIGEQESFRHGSDQVWHKDRFGDMSRVKRKRF